MRSGKVGILALAMVACAAVGSAHRQSSQAPQHTVSGLAWLAGCWAAELGGRSYEESWLPPRGGTMLGVSRTVRDETTVAHEFLRLYERDGRVVYAAHPSGQEPAEFASVEVTDSTVVFENPQHDFPQRILYRLSGDSLRARVEGEVQGEARGSDFPMARVECG